MGHLTPLEMLTRLISMGYATPATIEPSAHTMPTAYVTVPTTLAFATPPVSLSEGVGGPQNAKLGSRPKSRSKKLRFRSRELGWSIVGA